MAALYFLLFLTFSIVLFLLLMSAWFNDRRPSPGLLLLLIPAIIFLMATMREFVTYLQNERTKTNLATLLAEGGFSEDEIASITYRGSINQYGLLREFDMPQENISTFYDALTESEAFFPRTSLPEYTDCETFTLTFTTESRQSELIFHSYGIEESYLLWNDAIYFTPHSPYFMIDFFDRAIFDHYQAGDALSIVSLLESRGIFQHDVTGVSYTYFPSDNSAKTFTTSDASELYWEFDHSLLYRQSSSVELPEEHYSLLFTTPDKEASLTLYIAAPDEAYVLWEENLYFTPQDILGMTVYSLQHADGNSSGEICW